MTGRRYKVPRKKRRKKSSNKGSSNTFWNKLRNTEINNQESQLYGLLVWLGLDYKYVGNAQLLIKGVNHKGNETTRCPDFVSDDGKRLIELNGPKHTEAEVPDRIGYFAKAGYQTLIIWTTELAFRKRKKLVAKLLEFEDMYNPGWRDKND